MKTALLIALFLVILACVRAGRKGGIYQYVNKATGVPAYIGTTNDLNRRYNEHAQRPFANSNTHQYLAAEMNGAAQQRYRAEAAMIQSCKANGGCAYNKNNGGGGPR